MFSQLIIVVTFLFAMILSVFRLPDSLPLMLAYLRPEWITLVLIYWAIALPKTVGMKSAWIIGLLTDALLGSLLGQHAFVFMLVVYISSSLYQRLRMMASWQQSLFVFAVIFLSQSVFFWTGQITGTVQWTNLYFLPSIISALLWPWIFIILRSVRRKFNIS
tara:strand:- start:2407 stop:2892 length:486 start_codon:yes stop_codon:yes gene_type:complete